MKMRCLLHEEHLKILYFTLTECAELELSACKYITFTTMNRKKYCMHIFYLRNRYLNVLPYIRRNA